jgi:hypothetical protein
VASPAHTFSQRSAQSRRVTSCNDVAGGECATQSHTATTQQLDAAAARASNDTGIPLLSWRKNFLVIRLNIFIRTPVDRHQRYDRGAEFFAIATANQCPSRSDERKRVSALPCKPEKWQECRSSAQRSCAPCTLPSAPHGNGRTRMATIAPPCCGRAMGRPPDGAKTTVDG